MNSHKSSNYPLALLKGFMYEAKNINAVLLKRLFK